MTVSISNRVQELVCIVDVPYDFQDEKTGERVRGTTRKVCFREYTDGALSGLFIAKAVGGFSANTGQRGVIGFDRYGKINTFTPVK